MRRAYWVILALVVASGTTLFGVWRQSRAPERERQVLASGQPAPGPPSPPRRVDLGAEPPQAFISTAPIVANLAAKAGPFLLCVGQVRPAQDLRMMIRPRGAGSMPPPGLYLYFNVYGPDDALAICTLDAASVRAEDDRGRALRYAPDEEYGFARMPFPGGVAFPVRIEMPERGARTLRAVSGSLVCSETDGKKSHPFLVRNVPLPNHTRIFGRAAPRALTPDLKTLPKQGLGVLTGLQATDAIRRSRPLDDREASIPQRLTLEPGTPYRLGIPGPAGPEFLEITAVPARMGAVDVQIRGDSDRWSGRCWDGEDLLAVPGRGALALALRFTRDSISQPRQTSSEPPFLPAPGRPGGSLASSVQVGDHPFGRGRIEYRLRRREAEGWSEPRAASLVVEADGSVTLPNLPAGEYALERTANRLLPQLPLGEPAVTAEEYIRERFGIRNGRWTGERITGIHIRDGQRTSLPPLRFVPSRAVSAP